MGNALLLLQLITQAGDAIMKYSAVLVKANAEGRDVTDEEVAKASIEAQSELDRARAKVLGG